MLISVLGMAMSRVPAEATAFAYHNKKKLVMIENFGPKTVYDKYRQARTDYIWFPYPLY